MKGQIIMSAKEERRIEVMEKLIRKEIKQNKAAKELGISTRQVIRMKKRYKQKGAIGLIHLNRGKESKRKVSQAEIDQVIERIKKSYWDFGPQLAYEKLQENGGLSFRKEKLRQEMIKIGLWKPKQKKKVRVYQMRERRSCEGELVQIDGSPHDWLESGEELVLLVYIDDATGKLLHLELVEVEDTKNYFQATKKYLERCGKPLAFYCDRHSVFRVNSRKNGSSEVTDSNGLTQFGRAMKELEIELIFANSPQAKGRVERVNQTLQDRLVKEFRLREIKDIVEANKFLDKYQAEYNRRFSVTPRREENAHRELRGDENLEEILVSKEERILSKDLELSYKNSVYQIQTERVAYAMRKVKVTVNEDNKGEVKIYYQGRKLDYRILTKQPKAEIIDSKNLNSRVDWVKKNAYIPLPNHPWRRPFLHKFID